MASDPYAWAQNFAAQEAQRSSQRESTSQQMLMNLFQEEAMRQRPYAQMPARLAEAEFDRRNSEKYNIRSEQRRYRNALALAKAKAGDDVSAEGGSVDADGNEIIVVGGKSYVIPASKKPE
ncbi:MAG: hypothetical protein KKH61_21325 [Gammaproteobacteria bacterium]|uniref:Uncharacterized protein n=1 Tax=viral metagenome TaxID=1070528 RepID=A0A6H1ZB14_9ZZZZ|nr:hypothetical protein [Gammaproteobacteria bacterium]